MIIEYDVIATKTEEEQEEDIMHDHRNDTIYNTGM